MVLNSVVSDHSSETTPKRWTRCLLAYAGDGAGETLLPLDALFVALVPFLLCCLLSRLPLRIGRMSPLG
jgi:hypothetical protein